MNVITKNDIKELLTVLEFIPDLTGGLWCRDFPVGCSLEVDVDNECFHYKKAGIDEGRRTTTNFSDNENFVVFECVCRLLEQGYKPIDIHLEPAWPLGHSSKGGRADILIKLEGRALIIIECKKADEFDGAWRDTQEDGAQLFSYLQQEQSAKFLCLYTSAIVAKGKIKPEYRLIKVEDNTDYLRTLHKPKTFASATTAKERFSVWRDTYHCEFATNGLFGTDIEAYKPGKTKYSADKDLHEIDHSSMQKKYGEFATILRKYNVSGHENAFDKLVNLFLAKVVDETENPKDLKFYWKGIAYDDAFSLQDRLQRLYRDGMSKFLGEKVTYIDEADVKKAFYRFERDPDATKDAILGFFHELKFYTNNDFSFIDVHNKRLFDANFKVLLALVQMLQDIKLKTSEPNQFLGDLFEVFLDNGVKQSEGQFFTPLPIVRFIISSLPLQEIVRNNSRPPRVIDYACGAGHFLNEYARQIRPFIKAYATESDKSYFASIIGIEKEYRLSKVAKVAAFMYGEDDIKIIYADALAKNSKVPEETFDILVANPPYSVDGFLQTLSDKDRERYELNKEVSDPTTMDAIQTFFVERAVQLLKPMGVAAIILPSSILSNGGRIYVKCREVILRNFDIVAIAELGSGTFGATGTNTATLFLRKKDAPPDFATHWKNRTNAWFSGKHEGDEVFGDASALERYCAHRKFGLKEYLAFLSDKPNGLNLDRNIEREKLYCFLMADANPSPVLVIKMPSETKPAKAFLGYEWSKRKGNEGIKYIGAGDIESDVDRNKGIAAIKTPLFDNSRLNQADAIKLNSLIRQNFRGVLQTIPEELKPYAKQIRLVDMLDFESQTFDKQFRTATTEKVEIESKFPLVKLGDVCEIKIGGTPDRNNAAYFGGKNLWVSISEMKGQVITDTKEKITDAGVKKSNVKLIRKGTTLLSFKLSIGKTAVAGVDLYTNEAIAGLIPLDRTVLLDAYLFHLFNSHLLDLQNVGNKAFGKSLNSKYLREEVSIPLPSIAIQKKVIAGCERIDSEYNSSRMTIEEYRAKISDVFARLKIVISQKSGGVA